MNCTEFEQRLNQLMDLGDQIDDLSWDPELERHRRECRHCRALHTGYSRLYAGLALLAATQPEPPLARTLSIEGPAEVCGPDLTQAAPLATAELPVGHRGWLAVVGAGLCVVLAGTLLSMALTPRLPEPGHVWQVATNLVGTSEPTPEPPSPLPGESIPGEAALREFVAQTPAIVSDVVQRIAPLEQATRQPVQRLLSAITGDEMPKQMRSISRPDPLWDWAELDYYVAPSGSMMPRPGKDGSQSK